MFNKTTLVLAFSTLVCASSAYAIVSARTPLVVGFKPVFTNKTGKGAVTGDLNLGGTVSVKVQDIANILGFTDRDGDKPDEANFKYSWAVEGNVLSTSTTVTIPNDMTLIGKRLVLTITPISISGEPLTGDPLVLDNLNAAGALGGDSNGNIDMYYNALRPIAKNLKINGAFEAGKDLTASYDFDILISDARNGAESDIATVKHLIEDHSVFVWGIARDRNASISILTKLKAQQVDKSHPNVVKIRGQVPAYTIQKQDVGELITLHVSARSQNISLVNRMPLGTHGNHKWTLNTPTSQLTIDIAGVTVSSPQPKDVKIDFISSATKAVNGVDGIRPVAARDVLRASFTPDANGSPSALDYTFQWKAAGNNIGIAEVGKDTFTPGPEYQGKVISVDVLPVKKAMP